MGEQNKNQKHIEAGTPKEMENSDLKRMISEFNPEDSQTADVETFVAPPEQWSWTRLEYLTRSPKRIRILRYLQEQPGEKSELADQLDIPRSTLLRTLKEMSEYGWTTEIENGVYDITPIGSVVVDLFCEFYTHFRSVFGLAQLYHVLPSSLTENYVTEFKYLCDINLSEVTVCLSTSAAPYAPMRRFAEKVKESDVNCVFLGTSNPLYNDPIQQRLEEGSINQLIIPEDIVNVFLQDEELNSRFTDRSVSVAITENKFRYAGLTTNDFLLIEGLDSNMKSQIVVELPFTSDIVSDLASQLIGQLEENAASFEK